MLLAGADTSIPWPATRVQRLQIAKNSSFLDSFLFGSANFLFGLEPVVEFGAGLIASLNVQFIGSPLDSFVEWQRFDRGFLCMCRCWHGDHLW